MKFIIFLPAILGITSIVIIMLIAQSCSSDPNLKRVEQGQMSKVHYQDHSYIVWSINCGGGLVHDPDCKCKGEK